MFANIVLLAPFLACLHSNKERKDTKHMGGDAYRLTLLHANNKYSRPVCVSVVTMLNVRNIRISDGCVYAQIRKGLGMHLVTYTNRDTVPFLLLVQYKSGLYEIEFTVSLFSNAGMILLPFLKILCISLYIKGGIAHFC